MAFPQVAAVNGGNNPEDSTEHPVNLPADIGVGDLLLVFFSCHWSRTITFPEGWTQLYQQANSTATSGCWYRIAEGDEGATITVTTSAAEKSAHTSYRITGYSGTPEVETPVTGWSVSPDPPSLTPTWGALDTLWFAACGYGGAATISAYPTDYTNGRLDTPESSTGCGVGTARRELNAESEDPAIFSLTSDAYWVTNTVAIQPEEVVIGGSGSLAAARLLLG